MNQVLKFKVDSASTQLVDVAATVDGKEATVKVPALEVHLSSPDGMMFPTFRFRTGVDEAKAKYVPGAIVTMTLEVEPE